ncbi:hypothetical protein ABT119_06040 [Streptomyces sp. NPDC001910]|uniref:hypothetical protein n=1 Tax=Streptomyces sp. NPDC001910 TaxID=3154403 RepID=UPI0033183BBE
MHDYAPDDDGYIWPTCAAGPEAGPRSHKLWTDELDRLVCRPCEERTTGRLTELPALFARLNTTAALMRGAQRAGGGSTGTKTPPIPPRLDVLALVGPGGVAARLSAIEDSWRQALGWTVAPWRGSPGQAVPQLVAFLTNNLLWACSSYEEVGQDIDDLRRLHTECTSIVNDKPRYGNVKIGLCPVLIDDRRCGEQLYASARSFKTSCSTCLARWEGDDEWRQLRAAQEVVLAETAGAAA